MNPKNLEAKIRVDADIMKLLGLRQRGSISKYGLRLTQKRRKSKERERDES